jgi:hypothetical protein
LERIHVCILCSSATDLLSITGFVASLATPARYGISTGEALSLRTVIIAAGVAVPSALEAFAIPTGPALGIAAEPAGQSLDLGYRVLDLVPLVLIIMGILRLYVHQRAR